MFLYYIANMHVLICEDVHVNILCVHMIHNTTMLIDLFPTYLCNFSNLRARMLCIYHFILVANSI